MSRVLVPILVHLWHGSAAASRAYWRDIGSQPRSISVVAQVLARSMKATVHRKVSRDRLMRVLSEPFTLRLPKHLPEPVTVVIFREEVVTGRVARHALRRIGPDFGALLVFASRDFTREATEIAFGAGVLLIASGPGGGWLWSDESLFDMHVSMSTGTKRP